MAEEGLLDGDRTWFDDPRSPFRRMGVTSHPEQGLVVLSLWAGDTCTATFRLPAADAARLISTLADSLAASVAVAPLAVARPRPRGWRARVARLLRRPSAIAGTVPLRAVK